LSIALRRGESLLVPVRQMREIERERRRRDPLIRFIAPAM
jgi:hypothetical protein